MILFHFVWDLWYFEIISWNPCGYFGQVIARTIGSIFVCLVGVSLSISYHRTKQFLDRSQLVIKYVKRGIHLLGWGMVITFVTELVLRAPVYFGILHLIGSSIILSIPFLPQGKTAGFVGSIIVAYTFTAHRLSNSSYWLLPLGLTNVSTAMSDYYPLFPWYGVVLIGIYLGNLVYPAGQRRTILPLPRSPLATHLIYLGRRGLIIYLTHQPILFTLTFIIAKNHMLK